MQVYSIKTLSLFYLLNAQDTADTLNQMCSRMDEGSVFIPHSKKERHGGLCFCR